MVLISNIEEPKEGLVYKSDNIHLKIGEKQVGNGILYLTEDYLMWKPEISSEGISVPWKEISLHAIGNDPRKCIYVMLEEQFLWEGVYNPNLMNGNANGNGMEQDVEDDSDNDEGNESSISEMTEIWLMPNDITAVDQIFQTMKECQTLHPDSADSISESSDFMGTDEKFDGENDENINEMNDMRNLNIEE